VFFDEPGPMSAAPQGGLPGTRPQGVRNESEAAENVREMFGRIAPRYDLLNHLLSLDVDKLWRRRVARRFSAVLRDSNARVLDLCCGTGDLAFAFRKQAPSGAKIIGSDFVPEMLARARRKAVAAGVAVEFIDADALNLPFASASFDVVSCAFGFRNLANYEAGLKEMLRVLKPGGSATILEFAEPPGKVFGAVYRFYFRRVLPVLGGMISGDTSAYAYLPSSVSTFPSPEALQLQMERAGFARVQFERWTGGIVTLHTGTKSGSQGI
jgi:demethylmenaquinone methyltransferase/2-methoxy-6-polyprenyl-1,4-benzoquinol methylase